MVSYKALNTLYEIYNYCLQEYMCRLINENVSEQEQLSL